MNMLRSVLVVAALVAMNAACYAAAPQARARKKQPVYHVPKKRNHAQDALLQNDPEVIQLNAVLTRLQIQEVLKKIEAIEKKDAEAAKKKKAQTFVGKFAEKLEAAGMEVIYTITKYGAICYAFKSFAKSYYGKETAKVVGKAVANLIVESVEGAINVAATAGDNLITEGQVSNSWAIWGISSVLSPVWTVVTLPFVS